MWRSLITVLLAFIVAFVLFYGVPNLIEWELLRYTSPWLASVAFGEFLGCAFLFIIGLRRTAVAIYFLASAFAAYLLWSHRVSAASLVWITGLAPALLASILVAYLQETDPFSPNRVASVAGPAPDREAWK